MASPLETLEEWRDNLRNVLVGPHLDCYWDSAPFHELVDTLVHMLPHLLDAAATMAEDEKRATAALVARLESGAHVSQQQMREAHPLALAVATVLAQFPPDIPTRRPRP